jgi:hypothetical protein
MISLQSREASPPRSICEFNASRDGRYAWFLLTWHPEKDNALEEIVAEIKLEIINSTVANISRLEIEKWLKRFFSDLHWKLHARLRKTSLIEKGISLYFGVLFDHELYYVQFGRIFSLLADSKKISPVGKDWKHHQVQSMQGLNLFGMADSDPIFKTNRLYIADNQRLVILSGELANKMLPKVSDPGTIDTLIESYATEDNPLWLILDGRERLIKPKKRSLSRLQISSIILLTISVLTAIYMMFGNRSIDQMVHKLRLSFREEKTLRLEQIPTNLNINTEEVRKYMDRIVNLPARNIGLEIAWTTNLPYEISLAPIFNLGTIYLASNTQLNAYDKKSRQLLWSKAFPAKIGHYQISQGNLIVSLSNQQVFGLKEDGTQLWEQNLPTESIKGNLFVPCEIQSTDDPRLDRSIVVMPSQRGISIIDPNRGETLSSLTLKQDLAALSTYDSFANCFYAVVNGAMLCIDLKIEN